jgi:hypothetical protein
MYRIGNSEQESTSMRHLCDGDLEVIDEFHSLTDSSQDWSSLTGDMA